MNIPIENIYYLLCYAWNKLDERDRVSISIDDKTELVDLLARVLINGTRILLKRGIDRSYESRTGEISGLKGKLELSSTLKSNLNLKQRTICYYDEFSANILSNQILVTTLYRLTRTINLDAKIKGEIKTLLWMFDNVDIFEFQSSTFKKISYNRNNIFYGFLLNTCELIYNSSLPLEKEGTWKFIDFTKDERKMNQLFEAFIRNFYKKEQSIYPTVKKEQIKWQFKISDMENIRYLPLMETDITLENENAKIIMDAKYYSVTMKGKFDKEKINSSNLYQLFSYILNQRSEHPKTHRVIGVLIYPTIDKEYNLKYRYENHDIYIKTINLNTHWRFIDQRLKDILVQVSNGEKNVSTLN
jgi:5-methylcytosine-specific restriction enzyme subunit McrC